MNKSTEATHIDLDTGQYIHIDNAVFVLIENEWVEESESNIRRLKPI